MTPPTSLLTDFGDVQVPLLAAMLLGGCTTKVVRMARGQSISAVLGPTVLFPVRLRHSSPSWPSAWASSRPRVAF